MIRTLTAPRPRAIGYRWRGMGLAAPAYRDCSPLDPACVAANTAMGIAWEQQVGIDHEQQVYDQCVANARMSDPQWQPGIIAECDRRKAAVKLDTPAEAVKQFYAGEALAVSQLRGELKAAGQPAAVVNTVGYSPVVAPVVQQINSNVAPVHDLALPSIGGVNIPWWGWALGAAGALFMLKGAR